MTTTLGNILRYLYNTKICVKKLMPQQLNHVGCKCKLTIMLFFSHVSLKLLRHQYSTIYLHMMMDQMSKLYCNDDFDTLNQEKVSQRLRNTLINKCSDRSIDVKIFAPIGNYDRPIDQPTRRADLVIGMFLFRQKSY